MKKLINKLLKISLGVILLLTTLTKTQALPNEITTKQTGIISTGEWNSYTPTRVSRNHQPGFNFEYIYWNDDLAFCIEPAVIVGDGTDYFVGDISAEMKELLSKVIYHGYQNTSKNAQDYVFTQLAVWKTIDTNSVDNWENVGISNFNKKYNTLLEKIQNHDKVASFANQNIKGMVGETITLDDTNLVLSDSQIVDTKGLNISKNGNQLTLHFDKKIDPAISIQFKKFDNIEMKEPALIYQHNKSQDILKPGLPDPVFYQLSLEAQEFGDVELTKLDDSNNAIQGAVFEFSYNSDMSNPFTQQSTGVEGKIKLEKLNAGTIYLREVQVPSPYLLDSTIYKIDIKNNELSVLEIVNQKAQGQIEVTKLSEDNQLVQGAIYEIRDDNNQVVDTLLTNEKGIGLSKLLPLGNYSVIETSVPQPLIVDSTPQKVSLTYKDQKTAVIIDTVKQVNQKAQGKIRITKSDSETQESLANVKFEIRDEDQNLIETVLTDINGVVESQLLPLGTYSVKEVETPQGYLLSDQTHQVTLDYKDQTTPIVLQELKVTNEKIKGKIQIVKVDANNEEMPIPKVKFGVYKLPSRELIQEVETDIDGFAYSSELYYGEYFIKELDAPQEYYLNENEYPIRIENHLETVVQYVKNDSIQIKLQIQKVDDQTKKPLSGAVFEVYDKRTNNRIVFEYLNENYKIVKQTQLVTNDEGIAITRGILPYGEYEIREVKAPKGYVLSDALNFVIDRDTQVIDLDVVGKITSIHVVNYPTQIEIAKVNRNDETVIGAKLQLKDFTGHVVHEWTSSEKAELITGLVVNEQYTIVEVETPKGYLISDPVEIVIEETKDVQTFKFINDKIPELKTTALFEDGHKDNLAGESMKVIDEVLVSNLVKDKEYTIKGKLIDAETQDIIAENETTFVASNSSETIKIQFDFDGRSLLGKTLVVFENLYREGKQIASHTQLTDKNQQVVIPDLKTTALFEGSHKEAAASDKMVVIDEVKANHLMVGENYVIKGKLLSVDNNEVIGLSETEFMAESETQIVSVKFEFDGCNLLGKTLVVFENLYHDNRLVASHTDLNDKNQQVTIPKIKTKAAPISRDEKSPTEIIIEDQVSYENLDINQEYEIVGKLMDKETNQPLLVNGKEVISNRKFTPKESEGVETLTFRVDSKGLTEKTVVVFEDLYLHDRLIATHSDINDLNQSVNFIRLNIKKIDRDNNDKTLSDAIFKVTQNGVEIAELTTDENGLSSIVLEKGNWKLQEVQAPKGYQLDEKEIEVEITGLEKNKVKEIEVKNKRILQPKPFPDMGDSTSSLLIGGIGILFSGAALILLPNLKRRR